MVSLCHTVCKHVTSLQEGGGLASSYPPSLFAESLLVLSHPPSGDFGCPGPRCILRTSKCAILGKYQQLVSLRML